MHRFFSPRHALAWLCACLVLSAAASGADHFCTKSQGGTWVLLGSWSFNAGTAGYVELSNGGTSGYVIADAVRFVKQ